MCAPSANCKRNTCSPGSNDNSALICPCPKWIIVSVARITSPGGTNSSSTRMCMCPVPSRISPAGTTSTPVAPISTTNGELTSVPSAGLTKYTAGPSSAGSPDTSNSDSAAGSPSAVAGAGVAGACPGGGAAASGCWERKRSESRNCCRSGRGCEHAASIRTNRPLTHAKLSFRFPTIVSSPSYPVLKHCIYTALRN